MAARAGRTRGVQPKGVGERLSRLLALPAPAPRRPSRSTRSSSGNRRTETWERVEERDALEQLLGELTPQQREVVVLRFYSTCRSPDRGAARIAQGTVEVLRPPGPGPAARPPLHADQRGAPCSAMNSCRTQSGSAARSRWRSRARHRALRGVVAGHARRRRVRTVGAMVRAGRVAAAALVVTAGGAGSPAPSRQLRLASWSCAFPNTPRCWRRDGTPLPAGDRHVPGHVGSERRAGQPDRAGDRLGGHRRRRLRLGAAHLAIHIRFVRRADPIHGRAERQAGPDRLLPGNGRPGPTSIGSEHELQGIAIPSGTTQSIMAWTFPRAGGKVEDYVFAAEARPAAAAVSIVSSA